MKAALLLLAVAGAALVAATHAAARQACTPHGDNTSRTFCGPAKANLHDNGKKYVFNEGGKCSTDSSTWSVSIGTITLAGKPKHKYIGVTVYSKKSGTHNAAVSWQLPNGTNESLKHAKATLAPGLKKGTFKGTNPSGGTDRGSFSCK
jgi:hypothetical protein